MKRTDRKVRNLSKIKGHQKAGRKPKLDIDQLLRKIVNLFVRHHPLDLTFSRISQLTGVPRPTLYYYFGNSLEKLIVEAAHFAMRSFIVLNKAAEENEFKDWDSYHRFRLSQSIAIAEKYPWAPPLYFRYRSDQGAIGQLIRDYEKKYYEKMNQAWLRFFGRPLDYRALRASAYLKLGLLFGVSADVELWSSEKNPKAHQNLIEQVHLATTEILKNKF